MRKAFCYYLFFLLLSGPLEQRVTDIPIIPMASQKNTVTDNPSKKKVMKVVDQNGFLKKKKKDKKDKKKEKEKKKE